MGGHVGEHRVGDDHRAAAQDKPQLHNHHGRRRCHGNWRPQDRNGRPLQWLPEWFNWRSAGHERDHDGDAGTDLRADARGLATPWSEASIANATAKLEESLAVKELKVPKKLMVMEEPGNAFEMLPFGVQPVIYAVDQDGKYVNEVGGEADPWLVVASVSNGTGLLINNITCAFKAGLCQFEDMAIDTMGHDYELTFSLTYGSDSVEDATSAGFDVGGRPLSVKFTDLDILNPEGAPFSAVVAVWDDALNMKAANDVAPLTATCTISLSPDAVAAGAALSGVTEVAGSQLMVSCSDADDFNHVGASGDFNVHRYPRTGNLKETSQKFSFKGDGQILKNVMAAMGDFLQSSVAGVRK